MTILGLLSEFSLPEVLLSVGQRTGRLRLYDVPKLGLMQIEVCRGQVLGMWMGETFLTDLSEMISELGPVMESGLGMFEFSNGEHPAEHAAHGISVEKFNMLLVIHADERLREQRALSRANPSYVLETSAPSIWMESKLYDFYEHSKAYLSEEVRADELAASLGVGRNTVRLNLTNLSQSGLVRLVDKGQANAGTAPAQRQM